MNTISILFYVYQKKGRTIGKATGELVTYSYKKGMWTTGKGVQDKPELIHERPIHMRVTINSQRIDLSTGEYIRPDKWNNEAKKPIGTGIEARRIIATMDSWKERVRKVFNEMDAEGKWVHIKDFKIKLLNLDKKTKPLLIDEAFEKLIRHKENKGIAESSINVYRSSFNTLKGWVKHEYGGEAEVSVEMLNRHNLYQEITDYFLKLGMTNGSVNNIISLTRQVFEFVEKSDSSFKFIGIKPETLSNKSKFKFYTQEQQKAIIEYQAPEGRLDLWLMNKITQFQMEVGLAHVDLRKLKHDHIQIKLHNGEKRYFIYIHRQKSKEMCIIPLSPTALRLIEELKPHVKAIYEGAKTGIYSSDYQKFIRNANEEIFDNMVCPIPEADVCSDLLTEMGQALGFHMTTHMARHTFATNMLNLGIPIESVSRMLGHKNVNTTSSVYAKVLDTRVIKDSQNLDWYNSTTLGQKSG